MMLTFANFARLFNTRTELWRNQQNPRIRKAMSKSKTNFYLLFTYSILLAACSAPIKKTETAAAMPMIQPKYHQEISQYAIAIAQQISQKNEDNINKRQPQALLRAVILAELLIDQSGTLKKTTIFRSNGDLEAETLVLNSAQRATPFPEPNPKFLDIQGYLKVTQAWLFDDNGTYQIGRIAKKQLTE